jgi:hypothetical protein
MLIYFKCEEQSLATEADSGYKYFIPILDG